jgi:hypothetical protein
MINSYKQTEIYYLGRSERKAIVKVLKKSLYEETLLINIIVYKKAEFYIV